MHPHGQGAGKTGHEQRLTLRLTEPPHPSPEAIRPKIRPETNHVAALATGVVTVLRFGVCFCVVLCGVAGIGVWVVGVAGW